jgi:hypothetical protein
MKWLIQARATKYVDGYRQNVALPTFFLDADIHGIQDEDHAIRIAHSIIDHFGVCADVSVCAIWENHDSWNDTKI